MARSNRQLTQFAVNKINQYLEAGPISFRSEKQGNTEVCFYKCPESACLLRSLRVKLFGELICSLVLSPVNPLITSGVVLFGGNFYDSKGRPSRTTRERLNGILDILGERGVIPSGLRAFINPSTGECCIGKGDQCRPLSNNTDKVVILANPDELVFS